MIEFTAHIFRDFDLIIQGLINKLLVPYDLSASGGQFTKYIPLTIRIGFYILLTILPFAVLKTLYPFKKRLHYILIYLIFFLVMDIFFFFIEFFEILYT